MSPLPEWILKKAGPLPEGKCLIGVSGGADSVALLYLFAESNNVTQKCIETVHVNHGLRGAESDRDEAFVRELCAKFRIPLHVFRVDLQGHHDENAAREARFRCFRECMAETGSDRLILGHHADDLAETFLMRLLRGTGSEGLSCMASEDSIYGIQISRPLLRFTRAEIRRALLEASIPWREDSTNEDMSFLRNNIRKNILPRLEELNPGAAVRIARTSRFISEDNESLDYIAEQFIQHHAGPQWIRWQELKDLPYGLQKRILRMWWRNNSPLLDERELNAEQTERLVRLIRTERGKINLPGGVHAVKGRQAIHITGIPGTSVPEIPIPAQEALIGDVRLRISGSAGNPGNGRTEQECPKSYFTGCVIRSRKPGDWIVPFGMHGKKLLQDYLVDRGIDEPWRDRIPLICRGNEVLMAAGVGTGQIPEWDPTNQNIRICWSGEMPWTGL